MPFTVTEAGQKPKVMLPPLLGRVRRSVDGFFGIAADAVAPVTPAARLTLPLVRRALPFVVLRRAARAAAPVFRRRPPRDENRPRRALQLLEPSSKLLGGHSAQSSRWRVVR